MAQRTEKEETEFKAVPETLTLCSNNCGVTGNPATNNMCQICFNATTTSSSPSPSPSPSSTTTAAVASSGGSLLNFSAEKTTTNPRSSSSRSPDRIIGSPSVAAVRKLQVQQAATESTTQQIKVVNRCSGCRRKVGLTGFRCRCGELFCGDHRYTDRHDCSYDYKAAGRETIARENPVVRAAKIVRV